MIHRFIDLVGGCTNRGFYVVGPGNGGGAVGAIWAGKHNQPFIELPNTRLFTAGLQGDPNASPDFCSVVYADIPNTGLVNFVTVAPTNGTLAATDIASEPNALSTGTNTSMAPRWSPDGSRIVYHGQQLEDDDPAVDATIKIVDPDGSNLDVIYSEPTVTGSVFVPGNFPGRAFYPQFSSDGTKIVFHRCGTSNPISFTDRTIYTMDPDGTNLVQVASCSPFSGAGLGTEAAIPFFLAGTTQVVYFTTSTGDPLTGDYEVRIVDADGTNDTLLYTDTEPVTSHPGDFYGPTPLASLPDGAGVVYLQYDSGEPTNFDHIVGIVDAGGGGFSALSPQRVSIGADYRINYPVVETDGRIWWDDGMLGSGGDGIVSVLPDGTDFTVEDNTVEVAWFGTA